MWDLIVSVPDHCLPFYSVYKCETLNYVSMLMTASVVVETRNYSANTPFSDSCSTESEIL